MKIILATNLGIGDWLIAAFSGIVSGVSAICVFLTCIILSVTVIGILWGKLWNKNWNLSGMNGILVMALSLIAALSLSLAEVSDGGNFFQANGIAELNKASKTDPAGNPRTVKKGDIGYDLVKAIAPKKDVHKDDSIVISPHSVNSLKTTYNLLIGLFFSSIIGLIITIATLCLNDLKRIPTVSRS